MKLLKILLVIILFPTLCYLIVMGIDLNKPTTATNTSGNEALNISGNVHIFGDGTTDKVLIGFQKDGFGTGVDYGIKIAQEGYDVKTATDGQLAMSSEFNNLKVIASGTKTLTPSNTGNPNYTVSAGGYTATVTLPEGLSSVPAVIAYQTYPIDLTSGSYTLYTTSPMILPYIATNSGNLVLNSSFFGVTTTTLTFYYNQYTSIDFGVTPTITFKYFVLVETIN